MKRTLLNEATVNNIENRYILRVASSIVNAANAPLAAISPQWQSTASRRKWPCFLLLCFATWYFYSRLQTPGCQSPSVATNNSYTNNAPYLASYSVFGCLDTGC